jgi:hypothetical protein
MADEQEHYYRKAVEDRAKKGKIPEISKLYWPNDGKS